MRSHGLTVLTDPNFLRRGERARLAPGYAPPRRADPALELDTLPPVDVVVLSSLREDRFDRIVRRRLPREVPIVAPAEARAALLGMGFSSVHALPAWGELRIERGDTWLQVTATPTRPAPAVLAPLLPAAMGAVLEFGRGEAPAAYRIWVSGPTAVDGPLIAELAPRLGDVDLALLHVGGATVLGLGGSMPAETAVRTIRALGPRTAVPLRLADFSARPADFRPLGVAARTLSAALDPVGPAPRIRLLARGDTLRVLPQPSWAGVGDRLPADTP